jgi:hypothetical protein
VWGVACTLSFRGPGISAWNHIFDWIFGMWQYGKFPSGMRFHVQYLQKKKVLNLSLDITNSLWDVWHDAIQIDVVGKLVKNTSICYASPYHIP